MEALLAYLKSCKIPVSYICIGTVHKDDVFKALKYVMIDDAKKIKKEYACLLAFDVKISPEAQEIANKYSIKIFTAKIIYHLFDMFTKYLEDLRNEDKLQNIKKAVFPCILNIV